MRWLLITPSAAVDADLRVLLPAAVAAVREDTVARQAQFGSLFLFAHCYYCSAFKNQ